MRSSDSATSEAQVSSSRRCSGPASRAGARGSIASTPRMRIGAFSGRYRIGEAGSVLVPCPAASAWSNAHCAMPASMPTGSTGDGTGCFTRSLASATISAARASNSDCRKRPAISAICSSIKAPDKARDIWYSARMRSSRSWATRACHFIAAVIWPISNATASITLKVSRYCTSDTLNEKRGGTYRKSNAATLKNAASTDGPRP